MKSKSGSTQTPPPFVLCFHMGQVNMVTMASTLDENDASWEKIKDPHNLLVVHGGGRPWHGEISDSLAPQQTGIATSLTSDFPTFGHF